MKRFFIFCITSIYFINISHAVETKEDVSGEMAGYCYGALLKSQQDGVIESNPELYKKYMLVTEKYENEIIKKCGSMKVNKDCHKKLSKPTRIFWGAANKAFADLSSPAPTSLLKTKPQGNLGITRDTLLMATCQ